MADRLVEVTLSNERNPADALTQAFARAERSIDAVVYKFSLSTIFKALEEALERGVESGEMVVVSDLTPAIEGMLLSPIADSGLSLEIIREATGGAGVE